MGLDCSAIAKLKDGSYVSMSLDRYYVFDSTYYDIGGEFDAQCPIAVSVIDGEAHIVSNIGKVSEWCNGAIVWVKENGSKHHLDVDYFTYWIGELLRFSEYLSDNPLFEHLSIEHENSKYYEAVFIWGEENSIKVAEYFSGDIFPQNIHT